VLLHDAQTIVAEGLGYDVQAVHPIAQGIMTFKVRVETGNARSLIVRFYPEGRETVVNSEPDLLTRLRLAGVPVPLVITDSRRGPRASLSYVVYPMIEGRVLSNALPTFGDERRRRAAGGLMECIVRLCSIDFAGYGELVDAAQAKDPSWSTFLQRSIETGIGAISAYALCGESVTESLKAITGNVLDRRGISPPPHLWGGFSLDNILVNDSGDVVGLIDFESCLSGDPLATLGYCQAFYWGQPFSTDLFNAWRDRLGPVDRDRLLLYTILRALRLAPYAHRPLPTGYPRDPLAVICPGFLPAVAELRAHLPDGGG